MVAPRALRDGALVGLIALLGFVAFVHLRTGHEIGVLAFDFEGTLWEPALAIREGRSPYPPPTVEALEVGNPALYPPLLFLGVLPLTVLPYALGALAWISLLALGVLASLWIVGVRDVRVYALAFLSFPVVHGLVLGNATLVLVLLVALAWRFREHSGRVGALVGVAVAAKLFLWPLLLWLVATGRYRATAVAGAAGAAAILVPWALIGFGGIGDYPALLRAAEELFATRSWSLATVLAAVGLSPWMAVRAAMLLGLAVALLAFPLARRRGDLEAFACVALGAILASPIAWPSYYALLLVPLAVARTRLSWSWLLVPLFWITDTLPRPRLDRSDIAPGGEWCCPPPDVPEVVWAFNHAPPGLLPALASALLGISVVTTLVVPRRWVGVAVRSTRRRALIVGLVVGVPLSAALLWLAVRDAELTEVWSAIRDAKPVPLAFALVFLASVYALQGARWRQIARTPHVPVRRFTEWVVSGIAVNNVVPGRVGDLLRARWLQVGARVRAGTALSTVFVDRVFDVVALSLLLALALPFVASAAWLRWIVVGAAVVLVGLVALLLAARLYTRAKPRERRQRGLVRRIVRDAVEGLADPIGRRRGVGLLALSMLVWASWGLAAWLVARSLGIELTALDVAFVAAVMNLGVAIPSSPGFVGTYQGLGVASLGLLGVANEPALAFAILMHATWYVPTLVLGGGLLLARMARASARAAARAQGVSG